MERPPERSKRLHNFTLPYLRWGQQRFLRCVNLPSHHLPSSSSSPSPDHAANRSVVAAVRPWNLRTRRAACSEPGDESPAKIEIGVKRGVVNGEEMEKDEKLKFSVSLMKKEIEEDFSNMIGKRLPRRPKKRPRTVQKKLNTSNECLTTIFRQITPFYYFIPNLTTSSHQLTYEFYSKPYNFHCSKKAKFDIVLLFPNMICTESNHQRISFSSDLGQSDNASPPPALIRRDESLLDSSNSSFEFHISNNFDPGDSSPADEIFADGMILPFHVTPPSTAPKRLYKYELPPITSSLSPSPLPPQPLPPKHIEKDTSGANSDSEAEKSSKSFWSFKRSSSLNCDLKKSLICSFPRLTRSNSTGSVTNSKRAMLRDVNNHRVSPTSSSSSSSVCCNYHFRPQKHTGKKGEAGGGSFSAIPVLSGPSTFGLGSFLRHSKKKKNKK
uniref:Uncharacterized protein n=1 Tax=Brassica oleracea TaxID=3712 RepID=A0A3P6GUJ4_BRAOL|nr:unnamed protein product [Brassica oleracea]